MASFKMLKQHYTKVHASRDLSCLRCGGANSFANRVLLERHEKTCGREISCGTCGAKYGTVEALQTHARRKGHQAGDSNWKKGDFVPNERVVSSAIVATPPLLYPRIMFQVSDNGAKILVRTCKFTSDS